jgi:hypothetical protein
VKIEIELMEVLLNLSLESNLVMKIPMSALQAWRQLAVCRRLYLACPDQSRRLHSLN